MRMPSRRQGFSLLELLIASGLVGLVLALGVGALMEVRHVARVTQAKLEGRQEASKAVQEITTLLRRAHIIYFTGRPLANFRPTNGIAGERRGLGFNRFGAESDPTTEQVPDALYDLAPLNNKQVPYDFGNLQNPTAGVDFEIARFRFFDFGTDGQGAGANPKFLAQRLRTADTTVTDPFDRFFPSPLAYFAEAHFNRTPAPPVAGVGGAIDNGDLPLYWDFHVLYLAPMDTSGDNKRAGWLAYNTQLDTAPAGWQRSKIPFELRLLTIRGVDADRNGQLLNDSAGAGRARDPQGGLSILRPPFDYDWDGNKKANYDPIRVPATTVGLGAGETGVDFLDPAKTFYRWIVTPGPVPVTDQRSAGGERVQSGSGPGGLNLHANYDNLGNDPPTQLALTQPSVGTPGQSWPQANDRVLASYVDPDSVHGTCVRLENNLNSDATKWQPNRYRRYLNAMSVGRFGADRDVDFLFNHYVGELDPAAVSPTYDYASQRTVPRRALVSVTTRYRTNKREKFSFATETMEVELEGAVRFQSDRTR